MNKTTIAPIALVRHRFNVWIDVPAVSGDGWNKDPDYSAAEIGRLLRRTLQHIGHDVIVEHGDTMPFPAKETL